MVFNIEAHLASVTVAMSVPRLCGRGRVQRKCRLTGLKARTVPSAQPQNIRSSVTDRAVAKPVWKCHRKENKASVYGWTELDKEIQESVGKNVNTHCYTLSIF